MSKQDIVEEAEALCAAATPGPWISVPHPSPEGGITIAYTGPAWDASYCPPAATSIRMAERTLPVLPGWPEHAANAAFIARARTLVPELAAEVKRLSNVQVTLGTALQQADATIKGFVARVAELEEALKDAASTDTIRAFLETLPSDPVIEALNRAYVVPPTDAERYLIEDSRNRPPRRGSADCPRCGKPYSSLLYSLNPHHECSCME